MEAAAQLRALGHEVIIIEKENKLGGHVASWHKLFPDMTSAKSMVEEMKRRCSAAEIITGIEVNSINRLKDSYNIILSGGRSINADAVLVASGFTLFEASKKEEYGYGIYDKIVTNRDIERWLGGELDPRIPESPQKIGFVHCVGSRDLKAGNSQCSKVCCMTAIKQAIELKEKFPLADIYCFYMDLRLFGKKYEDFYISAQKDHNIRFIRGRVSEVGENIEGKLVVKAEDTLSGKPVKVTMDLLVLMSGMLCGSSTEKLAQMLRLDVDSDGFFRSRDNVFNVIESERPGVFFAGACSGTKTVPETISEARAAALAIHNYLTEKN